MDNKRAVGTKYEQIAGDFLKKKGVIILEYNFSSKNSEIDIIGNDNGTLVFFEVKYRTGTSYGEPYASVNHRKQKKIRDGALAYLLIHNLYDEVSCRFDVISICGKQINWIKDAF